jgi:N-acetylmuramoyl-L-alanine amidase
MPGLVLLFAIWLPISRASGQEASRPLIVIDAGHGGIDPGAIGPSGTLEKAVTLRVASQLAALLATDPRLDVRMTRQTDVLIPLSERPRLANVWRHEGGNSRPALFLSIHANAHQSRAARGIETYFLAEALTEDARRVAAMENAAARFEPSARPAGDELTFILNDLRQNHYLHESSAVADLIQRTLVNSLLGPDRGVKQAGFVVLDGSFMPAVLVEVGFISNPQEEALLASPDYQRGLAERLALAVREFFRPSVTASSPAF